MMFGLQTAAILLMAGSSSTVGEWEVACSNSSIEADLYDECRMTKTTREISVEIIRTAEGVSTSVRQRGCNPREPVKATVRTQEQLASENGPDILIGSIIENLMLNQAACRARGGALVIPMQVDEAEPLLEATSALRGL